MTVPRRPRKATGMESVRTLDKAAGTAPKPSPLTLPALFSPGRPLVMGVLNVTPDSFSDGGRFLDPTVAIAHAAEMARQGADILDIGAESTRPYGDPVRYRLKMKRRASRRSCPKWSSLVCRCRSIPSRLRSQPGRSTKGRRSSMTCGACRRTPTWRHWWPRGASR